MDDPEALVPFLPSSLSLPTAPSSISSSSSSPSYSSSSSLSPHISPSNVSVSSLPCRNHYYRQSPLSSYVQVEEGTLRRHNAPPPFSSSAASPYSLSHLLSDAFEWFKEVVIFAQKVWMPLIFFGVIGCCHLLGWAMLVYSALAIWGPTTPTAAAAAASSPSVLAATSSEDEAMLQMRPPQFISGPASLADWQSLGFIIYMTSVFASFLWLQHFVRTPQEQPVVSEERRSSARSLEILAV